MTDTPTTACANCAQQISASGLTYALPALGRVCRRCYLTAKAPDGAVSHAGSLAGALARLLVRVVDATRARQPEGDKKL